MLLLNYKNESTICFQKMFSNIICQQYILQIQNIYALIYAETVFFSFLRRQNDRGIQLFDLLFEKSDFQMVNIPIDKSF